MNQKTKRTVSVFLVGIMLLSLLLSGCKKEDAEVLEEVDYNFSVYFGSGIDQIEIGELLDQYSTETGVVIEAIFSNSTDNDLRELERVLASSNPPAAFVVSNPQVPDVEYLPEEEYIKGVTPTAFELIGRGFVSDRRVLSGLVEEQDADAFIEALYTVDYAEWMNFVALLNAYIIKNEIASFTLEGQTFTFREKKAEALRDVNGVFAIEGGGPEFYRDFLLDQAFLTTTPQALTDALSSPTASAFALVDPPLSVYIQGLNDYTSYLAGSYAPGIRGSDFTSASNYGLRPTLQIFADGRAVFIPIESSAFASISEMNADRAANLIILPFKLPYAENGVVSEVDGVKVNASLEVSIQKEIYVNPTVSEEEQANADLFIQWITEKESAHENPLQRAVRSRLEHRQVIYYAYEERFDPSFLEEVFGKSGVASYLKIKIWDDQVKQEIKEFLRINWYEVSEV